MGFERLLYTDSSSFVDEITSIGGKSDNTSLQASPSLEGGLFMAEDSTPLSWSSAELTASIEDRVVNGDPSSDTSPTIIVADTKWSIGVDMEATQTISKIRIFDDGTAGSGLYEYGGTNNSLAVYSSTNGTTWNLIDQTFKPLVRSMWNNDVYMISLILDSPVDAQYWKVYANDGALKSRDGTLIEITQISVMVTNEIASDVSVLPNTSSVTIISNSGGTPQSVGDPDGGGGGKNNVPADLLSS